MGPPMVPRVESMTTRRWGEEQHAGRPCSDCYSSRVSVVRSLRCSSNRVRNRVMTDSGGDGKE